MSRFNALKILTPEETVTEDKERLVTFSEAQILCESSSMGGVHYYGARDKHFVYQILSLIYSYSANGKRW